MFKNIDERISHIRALALLAASDQSISEIELKLISHFSKKYGIDPSMITNELVGLVTLSESQTAAILAPISSREQKLILLNDLITISKIDGNYSYEEKDKIINIAKILSVSDDDFAVLEEMNNKMTDLKNEFKTMLELDETDLTLIELSFPN